MKYTLVKPDGTIGQTRDFSETPPILAVNKGKWLPDNPPAFNSATHVRDRAAVQSMNAAELAYELIARDPADVARDQRIINEAAEHKTVKKIPVVKQFRRLASKADVKAWVNSASNLNQLKDVVETLALVVWVQVQRDDRNDE